MSWGCGPTDLGLPSSLGAAVSSAQRTAGMSCKRAGHSKCEPAPSRSPSELAEWSHISNPPLAPDGAAGNFPCQSESEHPRTVTGSPLHGLVCFSCLCHTQGKSSPSTSLVDVV